MAKQTVPGCDLLFTFQSCSPPLSPCGRPRQFSKDLQPLFEQLISVLFIRSILDALQLQGWSLMAWRPDILMSISHISSRCELTGLMFGCMKLSWKTLRSQTNSLLRNKETVVTDSGFNSTSITALKSVLYRSYYLCLPGTTHWLKPSGNSEPASPLGGNAVADWHERNTCGMTTSHFPLCPCCPCVCPKSFRTCYAAI